MDGEEFGDSGEGECIWYKICSFVSSYLFTLEKLRELKFGLSPRRFMKGERRQDYIIEER